MEKLEKNEKKLKKQLKIYMKKVQDLEGRARACVCVCTHACCEAQVCAAVPEGGNACHPLQTLPASPISWCLCQSSHESEPFRPHQLDLSQFAGVWTKATQIQQGFGCLPRAAELEGRATKRVAPCPAPKGCKAGRQDFVS